MARERDRLDPSRGEACCAPLSRARSNAAAGRALKRQSWGDQCMHGVPVGCFFAWRAA